jgi:pimeloyl-ACP methyl ester carboxylesterase
MRFVFLHGGPGFNSFAEQAILGPVFESAGHAISFWNEPSRLRPAGEPFEETRAFEHWVASAERSVLAAATSSPVHLISHSFTVHAAVDIACQHPSRVASLVIVAPGANGFATFCNVLRLAHEDLAGVKPEVASAIADSLGRTGAVVDAAMRDGLMNVLLHDDRLFTHYWGDPGQMQASMAARARPDAQFDVESFFAVLSDFGERGASLLSTGPVIVPTLTLFGAQDRITRFEEQRDTIQTAIPDGRIEVLDGCSHYLHLDRPRHFVEIVADWATSAVRARSADG